jgi:two-component system OmpR family response regulator
MTVAADHRANILIVDDDPGLRAALGDYLDGHGFAVRTAADGGAMDRALARQPCDLIVLDVMMPGETGLEICRRLPRHVPVLMLSAAGETTDRIVGLELGATDYLAKPFDPRELLARIRSILRRPTAYPEATVRAYHFAGWRFDWEGRTLTDPDGVAASLTPGEFSLLLAFVERPGRILGREQLLAMTQGPLTESFDRAVDLAVSRLRRKLDRPDAIPPIETVRGVGYRFVARVERS